MGASGFLPSGDSGGSKYVVPSDYEFPRYVHAVTIEVRGWEDAMRRKRVGSGGGQRGVHGADNVTNPWRGLDERLLAAHLQEFYREPAMVIVTPYRRK